LTTKKEAKTQSSGSEEQSVADAGKEAAEKEQEEVERPWNVAPTYESEKEAQEQRDKDRAEQHDAALKGEDKTTGHSDKADEAEAAKADEVKAEGTTPDGEEG
jgi:hypothetical protein